MEIDEALRTHGRRVSQARRVVWGVLRRSGDHLSAQQIAEQVNAVDPSVNRSSVYRVLALFDELGLVRESRLAGEHLGATWGEGEAEVVGAQLAGDGRAGVQSGVRT